MYCKKCGKYNPSYNNVCMYCGGELVKEAPKEEPKKEGFYNSAAWQQQSQGEVWLSKEDMGVVLCLLFSILGLIIGLLLYERGSYERETFLSGWGKCFIVCIFIGILIAWITSCALVR